MKTKTLLLLSLFFFSHQGKAQYCSPSPTSVDANGIINVTIGSINNATGNESNNYGDYSVQVADIYQGLQTTFSVTYETGFTYETKIWVDWNDDFDFDDAGEEVYSGVSDNSIPTTLTGNFIVPTSATIGNHRLRIGGQDSGPVIPCYNGSYGTFEDYTVNVLVPSCTAPVATTLVIPNFATSQYTIQVNVTNLGSGAPSITDGITTWSIAGLGNILIGPFAFDTQTTLTLKHGSNTICDASLGTFNYSICSPSPTSVDGNGITNVTIGTINNTTVAEANNYGDYSVQITNVYQGLSIPFSITYETGFDYETKVWIDWNNDFDFDDAGEEVYSGISSSENPTTLSGVILIPVSASLGNHKMRIGGQDSGPVIPCYNGAYGAFEDYTVNIVVPTCTPPNATTTVNFDCPNNQYFVQANVTNLGSGTPSITDGITTWPVTTLGSIQVGPFSFASPVTLILQNGSDIICNTYLGTFNYVACPPINDNCANAVLLTPGGVYSDHISDGSNVEATNSLDTATTCDGFQGGDIWYKVTVPSSGNITIETGDTSTGQTGFDSVIAIYSGVCGSLTQIDCDDDSGPSSYSLKSITGQTPGTTLYIRVYEYNNDSTGSIGVAAYDASLNNDIFDLINFSAYPNPVNDELNLSYSSPITKVTISNLLGQEIISQKNNSTDAKINVSNLVNGAYLVKVEVDNHIKIIKIVKSN